MKKIKVFIVEDSNLMQKVISDILLSDPQIEVVGTSRFGKEALEKIPRISPDVVTLDINLPDIKGTVVLEELMRCFPTRVVLLSAHTQEGAEITMKALALGAVDFISKPSGEVSLDLYNFKEEIISKIKLAATVDLKRLFPLYKKIPLSKKSLSIEKMVVIGASTGGPKAILRVMLGFPLYCNATFLVVQHMPVGFTKSFAERLSEYSNIRSKEGEDREAIIKGCLYVAPAGYHMSIDKIVGGENKYSIRLDNDMPLVNYVRPAIDITMASVADKFDGKLVGVVLTGMGKDGLEGAIKVKAKGGKIIVQDERTCVVYSMPRNIVNAGLADDVLPLGEIGKKVLEYLNDA
ncbi:MAG: chemotaxis response regulator protein-glutamate methylesterase [Candidatus Omnitrophica bacterium]|nr:chemotaxis response regulator protein-glutamate methylesterase [Candidatus Omnitrophota bacterium]